MALLSPADQKEQGTSTGNKAHSLSNGWFALLPLAGTYTFWNGKMLKIHSGTWQTGSAEPGLVIEHRGQVAVGTGDGLFFPAELQLEGKKRLSVDAFLRAMATLSRRGWKVKLKHLETDLGCLAERASAHQDEFEVLRYQLQLDDEIDDARLDAFVESVAAPIREVIDCTQCANCCRGIDIYITLTTSRFWRMGQAVRQTKSPCSTLPIRCWRRHDPVFMSLQIPRRLPVLGLSPPAQSCRDYPAFAPDFRWTLENTIAGASICPIIYNVLIELVERIDSVYLAISLDLHGNIHLVDVKVHYDTPERV